MRYRLIIVSHENINWAMNLKNIQIHGLVDGVGVYINREVAKYLCSC